MFASRACTPCCEADRIVLITTAQSIEVHRRDRELQRQNGTSAKRDTAPRTASPDHCSPIRMGFGPVLNLSYDTATLASAEAYPGPLLLEYEKGVW